MSTSQVTPDQFTTNDAVLPDEAIEALAVLLVDAAMKQEQET